MSQEIFRKLRQMLMEKLDVYRELTDQEILETIDELIVNTLRESGVSLKEKVQLRQELFYSVRKHAVPALPDRSRPQVYCVQPSRKSFI